ncbi:proline--tRNA ligase [Philodulcilactobacillus myokoensis]|uniref:Proline--tRNA ligase n=1 Tax=Philodulcilactobacillus myokoensis TaxID=2929573 RepID=A0A9W6B1Z9_9LACO|nr:proline--tRNA ligase [Philodulcilactobacillus myokoensis]GLB46948.1 proline--tRNA ligase [Philodulcilactobacillus myokoensis]
MRQSKMFIPTLKEAPKGAEALSHKMMLRAGYIRQISAGVYAYLPLAYRVLSNIEQIVRDEMNKIGANEMLLPTILPAKLWKQSGRYQTYGPELFKFKNRHNTDFILGPTHEETIASLFHGNINSYKELPLVVYQIQSKYRDEDRPRYGLLRGREFMMKDAYSFTVDKDGLDKIYDQMESAYSKIFDRLNLNYRSIIGNGGAMGGSDSEEFSAPAAVGEDTIVYSDNSDYASNLEMAKSAYHPVKSHAKPGELKKISVSNEQNEVKDNVIKSVLYIADQKPVLVLIRADDKINEVKVKNYLKSDFLDQATDNEVKKYMGTTPNYAGPIDVSSSVKVIADQNVQEMVNASAGANLDGYYYQNVNPGRDFKPNDYDDFRVVREGETSPDHKGKLKFTRGIEIAHIFKLGTRYTKDFKTNVLDQNGRNKPIVMGCYGIGISRLLSAIAEQQSDQNGLVWPTSIAPFDVHVIPVNVKKDSQRQLASEINQELNDAGYKVLYDDRKERAGAKFADADLIGIPIRITVGRKADDGIVEVKIRKTGSTIEVKKAELSNTIKILLNELNSK